MGKAWLFISVGLLTSCRSGDSPGEPTPPTQGGIHVVSGNNVTDSVGAHLREPLTVEIRDSAGRLARRGTIVHFNGIVRYVVDRLSAETQIASLTSEFKDSLSLPTDERGRVTVRVKLLNYLGAVRIAISVPVLALTDTARFTARPGAAVRAVISPADTAIYAGTTFAMRGSTVDQWGYPRLDSAVWSVERAGISVSPNGVITADSVGRYQVQASTPLGIARAGVSVIPEGSLVAWRISDGTSTLVSVNLDGSGLRVLANADNRDAPAVQATWIPNTSSIIYNNLDATRVVQVLYQLDPMGSPRLVFPQRPPNVLHMAEPRVSANGQLLFFSAWSTQCTIEYYCLHRSKLDGSSLENLDQFVRATTITSHPAPSPDGSMVAYATYIGGVQFIKVLDIVSRQVLPWALSGTYPNWSPSGTDIAYVEGGAIRVVDPYGNRDRRLSEIGVGYVFTPDALSWSQDGRWIIARTGAFLNLVQFPSGAVLPLRHFTDLRAPALRLAR